MPNVPALERIIQAPSILSRLKDKIITIEPTSEGR